MRVTVCEPPWPSRPDPAGLAWLRHLITELQRKCRQPVPGFDCAFPVPTSVSTLRAGADASTQALIVQARSDVGGAYADSGLGAR